MAAFSRLIVSLIVLLSLVGCNRQDTDAISRIGRKIARHTKTHVEEMNAKLDLRWMDVRRDPTLQEKIQDRLRWENTLTEITFEVVVKEKEVELKGSVINALQRQRAVELAETVAGVDKVINGIQVRDAEGK